MRRVFFLLWLLLHRNLNWSYGQRPVYNVVTIYAVHVCLCVVYESKGIFSIARQKSQINRNSRWNNGKTRTILCHQQMEKKHKHFSIFTWNFARLSHCMHACNMYGVSIFEFCQLSIWTLASQTRTLYLVRPIDLNGCFFIALGNNN